MNRFLPVCLILCFSLNLSALSAIDTVYSKFTEVQLSIDGQANESCWASAEWHAIDEVWIPYGASVPADDFEGRYKVVWDEDFLYMLVEVRDNMLSDDHSNPLENWWDDDCLEIFIDEDRSMGDHERNENAFAYHISLSYDAIDLYSGNGGINYKDHIEVDMDTVDTNLYLWEIAFRIYDDSYNHSNPEESRVGLFGGKVMGLTVAYCDNDETSSRENFIGSVYMPQSNYNDSYKNADFFGVMKLEGGLSGIENVELLDFKVYPSPTSDYLRWSGSDLDNADLIIYSTDGQIQKKIINVESSGEMEVSNFASGAYIVLVKSEKGLQRSVFVKQ